MLTLPQKYSATDGVLRHKDPEWCLASAQGQYKCVRNKLTKLTKEQYNLLEA